MIKDIQVVAWKERLQFIKNKESIGVLILPVIYGVLFPFIFSKEPKAEIFIPFAIMILLSILSAIIGGTVTSTSFVTENEKRTLPTLFTTRLSNRAVTFGKSLFAFTLIATANFVFLFLYITISSIFVTSYIYVMDIFFGSWLSGLSLLLVPLLFGLLSIEIGLFISTKFKSSKAAAVVSVFADFPIVALFIWGMIASFFHRDTYVNILIMGVILLLLCVVFFELSVRLISRERLIARV